MTGFFLPWTAEGIVSEGRGGDISPTGGSREIPDIKKFKGVDINIGKKDGRPRHIDIKAGIGVII